jgi:hypothetical protein
MAADADAALAPKPLIYGGASGDQGVGGHIVSITTHPSRDILGVGDIVGKITLYVNSVFTVDDLYLILTDIPTEKMRSARRWPLSLLRRASHAEC